MDAREALTKLVGIFDRMYEAGYNYNGQKPGAAVPGYSQGWGSGVLDAQRETQNLRDSIEHPEKKPLTFDVLRAANIARLPQFKNKRGLPAHSKPDGSDWLLSAWCNAVAGELGELANIIKKIERGDFDVIPIVAIKSELADIATYLDILAYRCGVNLGEAVQDKFNEVSSRVDSTVFIINGRLRVDEN